MIRAARICIHFREISLNMSSSGSRESHEAAAKDVQNQRIVVLKDFDLNFPLPNERLDAAAQGSALGNENLPLQIGDAELNDVEIISPRKFEEVSQSLFKFQFPQLCLKLQVVLNLLLIASSSFRQRTSVGETMLVKAMRFYRCLKKIEETF